MSDDPTQLRVATEGPEHELGVEIMDAIGAAITRIVGRERDTALAMTISMSACAQVAGRVFGNLLAQGVARQQDQRRAGETVLQNFRIGAKQGCEVMLKQMPMGGRA